MYKFRAFTQEFIHFLFLGGNLMRITIDTELNRVIVPDTFYKTIDAKNEVLVERGADDKKIDYVEYVKEVFEKAMENPLIRKADVKGLKK